MTQKKSTYGSSGTPEISSSEFMSMFSQSPISSLILDKTATKILHINKAMVKTFGYAHAEIPDIKSWWSKAYPDPKYSREVKKIWQAHILISQKLAEKAAIIDIKCKDGTSKTVEGRVSKTKDHVIVTLNDITDRVISEKKITANEEKYKLLFENMNEAFALHKIILNKKGKPIDYEFIEANAVFLNRVGMKKEDVIGKKAKNIFPKTEQKWIERFGEVALRGKPSSFTEYSSELDKYYQTTLYSPQKDYFAATFTDVTEERRAKEKLLKSEERLSMTLTATKDGLWDWNMVTNEAYFDPRYYTIAGYEPNEFPMDFAEWGKRVHPDDKKILFKSIDALVKGKTKHYSHEFRFKTKSNDWMWLLTRGKIVSWDQKGKPTRMVGTHTDMSEIKKIQEELAANYEEIQAQNEEFGKANESLVESNVKLQNTTTELIKSEGKYHSLFENMLNGFAYHKIITNKKGKPIDYEFIDMNNAFEKLTGLKKKNVIGKKVTEALPGIEKDPADWIGTYGKVALTGKGIRFKNYAAPLKKWYSTYAFSPLKNHFAVLFEDITETENLKRRTEEELAFQKLISEISKDLLGLDVKRIRRGIQNAISKTANILGGSVSYFYTISNESHNYVLEAQWSKLKKDRLDPSTFHEISPSMMPWWHNMLSTGKTIEIKHPGPIKGMTKKEHDLVFTNSPNSMLCIPLNFKNKYSGFIGIDTEAHREWSTIEKRNVKLIGELILSTQVRLNLQNNLANSSKELKNSEEKYRVLFERSADPMLILDNGQFIACNDATLDMMRTKNRQEILRVSPAKLSPKYQPDGLLSSVKQKQMVELAFKNGSHRFEWLHSRTDGTTFPADIALMVIPYEGRNVLYTIWRDISENKKNQEDLEKAHSDLESLYKTKTEFITRVAHDLRTPLTPMAILIPSLYKEIEPHLIGESKKKWDIMLDNVRSLQKLIKQTLDISEFEARNFDEFAELTDMGAIVTETFNKNKISVESEGAKLTYKLPKSVMLSRADKYAIESVFNNLIINSLNFMKRNQKNKLIKIIAKKTKKYNEFIVSDNGQGVSKKNIKHLFDEFYKEDESRHEHSSGLGLSLCKKIIEYHDGEITAKSKGRGEGLEVAFKIPVYDSKIIK